jgi:hypothetical protein
MMTADGDAAAMAVVEEGGSVLGSTEEAEAEDETHNGDSHQ